MSGGRIVLLVDFLTIGGLDILVIGVNGRLDFKNYVDNYNDVDKVIYRLALGNVQIIYTLPTV